MSPASAHKAIPVEGRLFEDIVDGYFPLAHTIGQLLERQGFESAWLSLDHAPFLHLPGVAPTAPVPLRLGTLKAGTITQMSLIATASTAGQARLSGTANWSWLTQAPSPDEHFSPLYRLAEPAVLRGIGLTKGPLKTTQFGQLNENPKSPIHLLIPSQTPSPNSQAHHWGLPFKAQEIRRAPKDAPKTLNPNLEYLATPEGLEPSTC